MGALALAIVDVRDMLCAQALAVTDRAMQRVVSGATLTVICNTTDVQNDLCAWAHQRGHDIVSARPQPDAMRMVIRRASS